MSCNVITLHYFFTQNQRKRSRTKKKLSSMNLHIIIFCGFLVSATPLDVSQGPRSDDCVSSCALDGSLLLLLFSVYGYVVCAFHGNCIHIPSPAQSTEQKSGKKTQTSNRRIDVYSMALLLCVYVFFSSFLNSFCS